jgi:hypothetical protein
MNPDDENDNYICTLMHKYPGLCIYLVNVSRTPKYGNHMDPLDMGPPPLK